MEPAQLPLTLDELTRIQRTARRHLAVSQDPNLIDVGFGVALQRDRVDRTRGLVAVVLVRRKLRRVAADRAIPDRLRLRLRRAGRFVYVDLATDVVEVPEIVPSGLVFTAPGIGPAMAGAVIAWQQPRGRGLRSAFGMLTVGHAFPSADPQLVLFDAAPGGSEFNGRLYLKSRRPSAVDAAVVHVQREDLAANALIDANSQAHRPRDAANLEGLPVLAPADIVQRVGTRGTSLRGGRRLPFVVHAILPTMTIPTLGHLRNVITAHAPGSDTFRPGSSGSVWEIETQPAALQLAATPPTFQLGFGQALTVDLDWARETLARETATAADGLRLVGYC
jgi:hypothetical protein